MKRRHFLTSLVATAGTILGPSDLMKLDLSKGVKSIDVKAGDVVIAEQATCLNLPLKPKNGDMVQIIIENSTLERPCYIQSKKASVAGDREPLVLDSIANIKLIYQSNTKDWVLS